MANDTVSDLLTRIRNAHTAGHKTVVVMKTNLTKDVLEVLKEEGFINGYNLAAAAIGNFDGYEVVLRYSEDGEPAITTIKRMSKPGRRFYSGSDKLPKIYNGLGIAIISTSQGVISDREAKRRKIGGEILAHVA